MPQHRKADPKKYCRYCRKRLERKVFNGRLEDFGVFGRRQFCDPVCMAKAQVRPVVSRATHHWRARKHIRPACERCGSSERLEVHHRDENYQNDDPSNYETVCSKCHAKEHGPKRGRLLSGRRYVEKVLLQDAWIACREALCHLSATGALPDLRERLESVLHRAGQL